MEDVTDQFALALAPAAIARLAAPSDPEKPAGSACVNAYVDVPQAALLRFVTLTAYANAAPAPAVFEAGAIATVGALRTHAEAPKVTARVAVLLLTAWLAIVMPLTLSVKVCPAARFCSR